MDLIASTCTDVLERPTLGMCFVCVGASPARRSCPRFLVVVTTTLHLLFVCGGRALRVWCCGGRAFRVWCCGGELRSLLWCRVGSFVLVCTMWTAAASLCGGFFFVWLWSSAASCGFCCFRVCFICSVWACRCFSTPCTSIESRARMPFGGHQRACGNVPVEKDHPK